MKIVQGVDQPLTAPVPVRYVDMIGKVFLIEGDICLLVKSYYDPDREVQFINLCRNSIGGLIKNFEPFPVNRYRELPNAKLVI